MVGVVFTRGAMGSLREPFEGSGFGGACALARERHGFGWPQGCSGGSARPAAMQHDAEPQESQDCELVVNMIRNHGDAPLHGPDRGAF